MKQTLKNEKEIEIDKLNDIHRTYLLFALGSIQAWLIVFWFSQHLFHAFIAVALFVYVHWLEHQRKITEKKIMEFKR